MTTRLTRRIAVAGFDDGELAQTRDMTSYNFNLPAIVQAVFGFLIRPQKQLRKDSGTQEIPGSVSVRASTTYRIGV